MLNDLMELCETLNQKINQAKKREVIAQEVISKGDTSGAQFQKLLADGDQTDRDLLNQINENKLNKSDLIYFDEQVSMLERTALRFYPIILEVAKRMVRHKEEDSISHLISQESKLSNKKDKLEYKNSISDLSSNYDKKFNNGSKLPPGGLDSNPY